MTDNHIRHEPGVRLRPRPSALSALWPAAGLRYVS
jgi:hypothetical protein